MSERLRDPVRDDALAAHGRVASEECIAMHTRPDAPTPDAEPASRTRAFADRLRLTPLRFTARRLARLLAPPGTPRLPVP